MKENKKKPYDHSGISYQYKRILVTMRMQLRQECNRLSDAESSLSPKIRKTLYLLILTMGLIGNGLLIFQSLTN